MEDPFIPAEDVKTVQFRQGQIQVLCLILYESGGGGGLVGILYLLCWF